MHFSVRRLFGDHDEETEELPTFRFCDIICGGEMKVSHLSVKSLVNIESFGFLKKTFFGQIWPKIAQDLFELFSKTVHYFPMFSGYD